MIQASSLHPVLTLIGPLSDVVLLMATAIGIDFMEDFPQDIGEQAADLKDYPALKDTRCRIANRE